MPLVDGVIEHAEALRKVAHASDPSPGLGSRRIRGSGSSSVTHRALKASLGYLRPYVNKQTRNKVNNPSENPNNPNTANQAGLWPQPPRPITTKENRKQCKLLSVALS